MMKKGQVGQGLTSIPVIFLIILLMVVFVALSLSVFGIGALNEKRTISVLGSEDFGVHDFLFENVSVSGKEMRVVDAILKWGTRPGDEAYYSEVESAMISVLERNEVKWCLILKYSDDLKRLDKWTNLHDYMYLRYDDQYGTWVSFDPGYSDVEGIYDEFVTIPFSYEGGNLYLRYYYGQCDE